MNLIDDHNRKYIFFHEITGYAMLVHRKYRPGLLESAYEAALKIRFRATQFQSTTSSSASYILGKYSIRPDLQNGLGH